MASRLCMLGLSLRNSGNIGRILQRASYSATHEPSFVDPHKGKVVSDDVEMPDQLGHAVGKERYELLCRLYGYDDPYCLKPVHVGKGTWEEPYQVFVWKGTAEERPHWCNCPTGGGEHNYQLALQLGIPKRCACGYWFLLTERDYPHFMKHFMWPEGAGAAAH